MLALRTAAVLGVVFTLVAEKARRLFGCTFFVFTHQTKLENWSAFTFRCQQHLTCFG
ncbi:unnamed protein product [Brassica oleracea]